MKQEAQRIAIAEACGWKAIRQSRRWELSDDPQCPQDLCGRHPAEDYWSHLPDYLTDLNAIHEAEKVLSDEQWKRYSLALGPLTSQRVREYIGATAAQRAQAFLRTIGKWEEAP